MNPKTTLALSLSAASILVLASCAQNEPKQTYPSHHPYQSKQMHDSKRRADAGRTTGDDALAQANRLSDVNTTAQIRRNVLATRNMSYNARNIEIVTLNGHVTLRGPVNSLAEKERIGQLAERVAGDNPVDNQLTIRRTTAGN